MWPVYFRAVRTPPCSVGACDRISATAASFVSERAQRGHTHRAARRQETSEQRDSERERERAKREVGPDDEDRSGVRSRIQLANDSVDDLTASEPKREAEDPSEHPDVGSLREEQRANVARRRADRLHDPDLARPLEH